MPKCNKCGMSQSKLNKGSLCKTCFSNKINKTVEICTGDNRNIHEDNILDKSIIEDRSVLDLIKRTHGAGTTVAPRNYKSIKI